MSATRILLIVFGAIGALIVGLAVLGLIIGPRKRAEAPTALATAPPVPAPAIPPSVRPTAPAPEPKPCDGREAKRRAWLDTSRPEWRGNSPHDAGLRISGACGEKIVGREMSCAEGEVRDINGDSPYLRSALKIGFVVYVCELLNGAVGGEYPLARIVTK